MKSKNSITKNIFYKLLLNIFNIVVPLIIGPYAATVIGPKYLGRIYYSEAIYVYFLIIATFGIYNYGLREISRIRDDKEKLSKLFTSLFLIGVISNTLSLIIYILFVFVNYSSQPQFPVLLIYGFTLFSNIFYVEWLCEATESFNFITIKTIILRIFYIVLLLLLVKKSSDYLIYAALNSLLVFFNYVFSFVYIKKNIKFNFNNLQLRKHIKPLLIILIMSNASILYNQLDKLLLGSYVSEISVGYYNIGQILSSIVNTMLLSIILVTIPRLSNVIASNGDEAYETLLNKVTNTYLAFLFPAAIGMMVLSKEIILLLYKSTYIESVNVLRIFSVFIILSGLDFLLVNSIFYVKKQEKLAMIIVASFGLVNLLLKIILIYSNHLNHVTTIASTTTVELALVIVEYIVIKKFLKVNLNLISPEKVRYLLTSLLFIPLSFMVKLLIHNIILIILITMSLCTLVYSLILLFLRDEFLLEVLEKFKVKLIINKLKQYKK
ncbi:oligosaccharide flippase family protein [Clostridium sp. YIM B02505]|uniref:Oligosaccharide flippase family protein n=2 Tax=Clostridium yunnanense TaxID=2800325 RepID=A0ABS1ELN5_9CLOT|nr:oligosaccharide flippase family protein [Clostridium yunnanense]MBK1810286.1 oligosaccharide flippase family protein [Clostridium yunnanense]